MEAIDTTTGYVMQQGSKERQTVSLTDQMLDAGGTSWKFCRLCLEPALFAFIRGCEPLKSGKKARECQCRMIKQKLAMSLLPSVARSLLWVPLRVPRSQSGRRSRGTERCPVCHAPAQKRCARCLYPPDYRDNPWRTTGGVAVPADPQKVLWRQKTGGDAQGRPLRAGGYRPWAHTPPARPPPGAASAPARGGGSPNRQRA